MPIRAPAKVQVLTVFNGHTLLHLSPYTHSFVYYYKNKAPALSSDFTSLDPPPWVKLYRVDCADPLSKSLCYEESVSSFPEIKYYAGPGPGMTWRPKVQEFGGTLYVGRYSHLFLSTFLSSGPMSAPPCSLYPSHCTSSESSASSSLRGLTPEGLRVRVLSALADVDELRVRRLRESEAGKPTAMTNVELVEAEIIVKAARVAWDKMKKGS